MKKRSLEVNDILKKGDIQI